jgi:hypothetical protein
MRGFNRLGRRSGVNRPYEGSLGTDLGIDSGYRIFRGGDAEAVEALVCKTGLSGFESHLPPFLFALLQRGEFDGWLTGNASKEKSAWLTMDLGPR